MAEQEIGNRKIWYIGESCRTRKCKEDHSLFPVNRNGSILHLPAIAKNTERRKTKKKKREVAMAVLYDEK